MHPGCDDYSAHAVPHDDHILDGYIVFMGEEPNKDVQVLYEYGKVFRVSTISGGTAMSARIPGKNGEVIQI